MQKNKQKHLTLDERIKIELLLHEGLSLRSIADVIDKAPSTVSREIKKHASVSVPRSCDCTHSSECKRHHVCGSVSCNKRCKSCHKAKSLCDNYSSLPCHVLSSNPLHLCNSCNKKPFCHLSQRFYSAHKAHKQYTDTLSSSRNGFDLTAAQLFSIDDTVSPLVKKGQSVYHIMKYNRDSIPVSEATLRRLINSSELSVRPIDLPEAVKRRPRKKRSPSSCALPSPSKAGHLFSDFISFSSSSDLPVVQMDCIEGNKVDSSAVLSLHFVSFHMQLYFSLEKHDSRSVINLLDKIEFSLGKDLFASSFPLILTDNGKEFSDIHGIERSVFGGKRTSLFFCDPNRSDQKAQCENNHKLFRRIVPKGSSVDGFMQSDMTLISCHINSYFRKSLFGRSPFDLAMASLDPDFFILLGLEKIDCDRVILSPVLLS